MHLNNEQLIEPNDADLAHLSQCDDCRLQHENLISIRTRMQTIADEIPAIDQWQAIKHDFETRSSVSQLVSARKSNLLWKTASAALAASFAIFFIWQTYSVSPSPSEVSQDNRVIALIKESNSMQQQLKMQLTALNEVNTRATGLMVELDIINAKLEQAYLEKTDPEQKLKLWQQRQVLLKATLAAIKQPHVIKI
jgi:hypothetical protein